MKDVIKTARRIMWLVVAGYSFLVCVSNISIIVAGSAVVSVISFSLAVRK